MRRKLLCLTVTMLCLLTSCSKKEEEVLLPEVIESTTYSLSSTGKTVTFTTNDTMRVSTLSDNKDIVVYYNYPEFQTATINLLYSPNLELYKDLIQDTVYDYSLGENYHILISGNLDSVTYSNLTKAITIQ